MRKGIVGIVVYPCGSDPFGRHFIPEFDRFLIGVIPTIFERDELFID